MFDFHERINKNHIHLIFLFILSLNYLVPFILFGKITLFYHDSIDHEIVYNKIIGKYLGGDKEAISLFLNGEIQLQYLRRVFQPLIFLYVIFDTQLAYWITDILVKLTSYISFLVLAKKVNKNFFLCCLVSCFYAAINIPTHNSFGQAIIPYLFYLSVFKENLKIKHYLIIIFFGLNSDLVMTATNIPVIGLLVLFLNKGKFFQFFKISSIFTLSILISNWNLIFTGIDSAMLHRSEFVRDSFNLFETISYFFISLMKIPPIGSSTFLITFPQTLIVIPLFFSFFFLKDKEFKTPLLVVILMSFFISLTKLNFFASIINESNNLIKTFTWDYLGHSFLFFYTFSIILLFKNKNFYSKSIFCLVTVSIFFLQINSSIVPFIKEKILKTDNYQNLYTFDGYYNFYNYSSIKKIVKNKRTISVGVDPMVAVYHGIKVIDGYHNTYPLSYKRQFRKIIEPELNIHPVFKSYYDNYGSRVYATLYHPINPKNIVLNFKEAKLIGADYVISKYPINSEDLRIISDKCKQKGLCLYYIK